MIRSTSAGGCPHGDPRAWPVLDRGAAAAELAVVLPAVVLVLGLCLGAVQTVGQQVVLTSAAEEAARSIGRGEDAGTAAARVEGAAGGASMAVDRSGHAVCVRLTAPSRFSPAGAAGLRVSARGCAWQEDPGAP
ncbi:TadE family type IV pilus minor pilin [Clavibacter michiganensis]|uniref:TadE family type IV pilus minor pilin n=1 Tax=Clavibacter michiganensis TaxID=28447 RepID=UPI0013667394|nr:TadE family type IV pilus minor pilin [Clavibacter michiganensis]MDO4042725.1 TadE family type IV pilus minor pilin [Clavibacter michiganensis]MDO4060856.1 TadE family type IV pilus minor pilin [Clavibacter michiganensis]MDO4077758.1 TadE family type IV pilus minor pilin [Clavibacter michiganensis]MDO4095095.1 TadE family type IV pilus minor pilin [Clavibacter michiganensis]MDO4102365.1 TadE family type IV pilus minor pilin [Clavibacter michiganensis]